MDWTGSGVVLRTKSSSVETITISRSPEVDLFLGYERDWGPGGRAWQVVGFGLTSDLPWIGIRLAQDCLDRHWVGIRLTID